MTTFEMYGVRWQLSAENEFQARKSFGVSCGKCTSLGGCQRCAIKAAHENRLDDLRIAEIVRREMALRDAARRAKR